MRNTSLLTVGTLNVHTAHVAVLGFAFNSMPHHPLAH